MKNIRKLKKLFFFSCIYIAGIGLFIFLLFLNFYPVTDLFGETVTPSTKIYDRNGILLYETLHPAGGKTTEVALEDLPKYLIQATIATEDQNFYDNSGVDFFGIVRAIFLNFKEGQIVSGGSTITQQLVRNVVGISRSRTFTQKIKESLLALRVNKVYSKDEILAMYFNKIYYGNLNYGVGAASRGYFGRQVNDLDLAQCAFLAGLPQAPNRYDPFQHREDALKRKDYVLSLMQKAGFITEKEMTDSQAQKLVFEQNLITVKAPHFVNYIIDELEDEFGDDYLGGLEVKTTLDFPMQKKVLEIAQRNLALIAGRNVNNASVVVLNPKTAEILTMLGSVDYFNKDIDGQVNVALRGRQPGSAMKPVTYAVAFEKGWTGATLVKDEPVRFFTADSTPYTPQNYDYEFHGIVTVRKALANSFNIPAVKAASFATTKAILDKSKAMGITTFDKDSDHYGLALTLGDAEVRLMDLASVYMGFANGGIKKSLSSIESVRDSKGKLLYESGVQAGTRVLGEDIAFMITNILSDNAARIDQFGLNNVLELDRPAAVKTGTTRNFKDNWTLGYTPNFVVGVWVGNSDNSQMHNVSGIYGAGPIWHDVMTEIHRNLPIAEFVTPASVFKKDGEWFSRKVKNVIASAEEIAGVPSVSEKNKIVIKSPFDMDVFQINPNDNLEAQQVRFKALKHESIGEITWFVNGEPVGVGDSIFWQLKKGDAEIYVSGKDSENVVSESEKIRISIL